MTAPMDWTPERDAKLVAALDEAAGGPGVVGPFVDTLRDLRAAWLAKLNAYHAERTAREADVMRLTEERDAALARAERAAAQGLTFGVVQATSHSRALRWHPGGLTEWSTLEWAGALCGEAGELANVAKKIKRIDDGIVGQDPASRDTLVASLSKEAADVVLYAFCLAARESFDLGEAVAAKFNEVSERNGFPERLADQRKRAREPSNAGVLVDRRNGTRERVWPEPGQLPVLGEGDRLAPAASMPATPPCRRCPDGPCGPQCIAEEPVASKLTRADVEAERDRLAISNDEHRAAYHDRAAEVERAEAVLDGLQAKAAALLGSDFRDGTVDAALDWYADQHGRLTARAERAEAVLADVARLSPAALGSYSLWGRIQSVLGVPDVR